MGRPKTFDRDRVLLKAVDTFWEKGYAGTSVQDLVDSMGIHRASLYDTYGCKEELFAQVLERYSTLVRETIYKPLTEHNGSPRETLEGFFQSVADDLCTTLTQGCLMIKSVLSLSDSHPELCDVIRAHTERVDDIFLDVLERAHAAGEVGGSACGLRSKATFLRHSLYGMIVTAAIRREREPLRQIARWTLSVLDRPA